MFVPGTPAVLTAPGRVAEPWKESVARVVAQQWSGGYVQEPCAVDLAFSLSAARFADTALFNLLKSTIDGLAHVVFAPSPVGPPGPWSREDWWITHLVARKRQSEGPVGVRINLALATEISIRIPSNPLLDVWIPGSPPLWPGSQAGQQKVLAWREAVARLVSYPPRMDNQEAMVEFGFVMEPERMQTSDLDNLVVPAAQAVSALLYGDLRQGHRLRDILATKKQARNGDDVGTRVRVWAAGSPH